MGKRRAAGAAGKTHPVSERGPVVSTRRDERNPRERRDTMARAGRSFAQVLSHRLSAPSARTAAHPGGSAVAGNPAGEFWGSNPAAVVRTSGCRRRSSSCNGTRNRSAASSARRRTRPEGIAWWTSVAPSVRRAVRGQGKVNAGSGPAGRTRSRYTADSVRPIHSSFKCRAALRAPRRVTSAKPKRFRMFADGCTDRVEKADS